jgi:hypothetical protein
VVTSSGSGDKNRFNVDSTLIYVQNTVTLGYPMTFDPLTMHASRMYVGSGSYHKGMRIAGGGFWSGLNPNLLFQISCAQLTQYDFADGGELPSSSVVYDFATLNCLGAGFTVTWSTIAGGSAGDRHSAWASPTMEDREEQVLSMRHLILAAGAAHC